MVKSNLSNRVAGDTLKASIESICPSNFAFIMATGSLSMAFYKSGWPLVSYAFMVIAAVVYVLLLGLFITRICLLRVTLIEDLKDIQKMFRYLTFSAGSSALAVCVTLMGSATLGLILGAIGALSAIVLTYILFCAMFFHIHASIQIVSPFWLLLAIACNSSGIVISTLWNHQSLEHPVFLLFAFCFWTFGVFIYVAFMTLNMYRMIFFPFTGKEMDPCYWTCMGAAAIAVVDGCQLISVFNAPPFIVAAVPFIRGVIFFLWAWGTAWIPILCLMELWKALYFKVPFHYQPSLWAMVFPLCMYTIATTLLGTALDLYPVQGMVPVFLWISFMMWCIVAYMSRLNPFSVDTIE